jgi:hypothetical protein
MNSEEKNLHLKKNFTEAAEIAFIRGLGTHCLRVGEAIDYDRLKKKKFNLLTKYIKSLELRTMPDGWNKAKLKAFAVKELTAVRVK